MPKIKENRSNKLLKLVKEYPDLKTDGSVLICNVCSKHICADKTYNIKQHLDSQKHKALKERESIKSVQQSFLESSTGVSAADKYCIDLCEAFVSADIPMYKIRHCKIQQLLQQYTKFHVPSESSLRNKYFKTLYESTVKKIKMSIKDHFLWVSIDETTDSSNRYVANVIVGILHLEEEVSEQRFLINTEVLEKVNHTTIARLFDLSMNQFEIDKDKVLIFVTDAAPYMVKAANAIGVFYPNITHVTCLAHGVHRVCEQIRENYSNVDLFISNAKKTFLKSPARIQIFRETAPNLPLPPQPVITRWGTWIMAVNYYAKYFDEIVNIFSKLNTNSSAVSICQSLIKEGELRNQILYIAANFGFLNEVITKLETKNQPLVSQVNIIKDAIQKIANVKGDVGVKVHAKFKSVISKNKGFSVLNDIVGVLSDTRISNALQRKYTSE